MFSMFPRDLKLLQILNKENEEKQTKIASLFTFKQARF